MGRSYFLDNPGELTTTVLAAANPNGGIIHQEAPIAISNVMYCVDGKVSRIGYQMDGDKKVRVAKATGKVID